MISVNHFWLWIRSLRKNDWWPTIKDPGSEISEKYRKVWNTCNSSEVFPASAMPANEAMVNHGDPWKASFYYYSNPQKGAERGFQNGSSMILWMVAKSKSPVDRWLIPLLGFKHPFGGAGFCNHPHMFIKWLFPDFQVFGIFFGHFSYSTQPICTESAKVLGPSSIEINCQEHVVYIDTYHFIYSYMYVCMYTVYDYVYIYVYIYMYIYMYTSICILYVYIYVYIYICIHLCIYIYICIYMYTSMYIYICIYIYVYVYIWMYVCMYVCMFVCLYVCMYACMHACMYVCMFLYVFVCFCIHVYVFVYMYICICIHVYWVYVYVYVYIWYIFIYICFTCFTHFQPYD